MRHLNLFYTALNNLIRYPLRSVVIVICLVALLLPFLSGTAILEGVKAESLISVHEGADIYLTMDMYGRNGVIPLEMVEPVKNIEGVIKVIPRAISRIYVGNKLAVLLGIPVDNIPETVTFIKGRPPIPGEVVIGKSLAEDLRVDVGEGLSLGVRIIGIIDGIPYVVRREFKISGIFDARAGIWTSNLLLMNLEDVISLYEMEGFVTDMALYVKQGYFRKVSEELQRMNPYFRIQTKELVKTYVDRGFNTKGGIFLLLYTVAFSVAIPAIAVSSGLGLSERRKEIGILKAIGWRTVDVIEMVFLESIVISLMSVSITFILSLFWLKILNGVFIAQIFIPGAGIFPSFHVPSLFFPLPVIMTFLLSLIIMLVGSISTTWKTSIVPPMEAMR